LREVKRKRLNNFNTLHSNLKFVNEWSVFNKNQSEVPLCYPFLVKNGGDLKKHLIHKNIYIPTYWHEIEKHMNSSCEVEKYFINNLVCLPIDQRYNKDDMLYILKIVKDFING
jgi:dTDP-4-amino-4,6-dideoxygalactose transaminase